MAVATAQMKAPDERRQVSLPSDACAWPARSDELLRAAGYDPDAIRRRKESGAPWRMHPRHMVMALAASAFVPTLALVAFAIAARVVVALF